MSERTIDGNERLKMEDGLYNDQNVGCGGNIVVEEERMSQVGQAQSWLFSVSVGTRQAPAHNAFRTVRSSNCIQLLSGSTRNTS